MRQSLPTAQSTQFPRGYYNPTVVADAPAILPAGILIGMEKEEESAMSENSANELCRRLAHDIEPMQRTMRLAQWDAETTGSPEAFAQVEHHQKNVMRRLSNREDYALADRLRSDASLDSRTRRELLRWRNFMAPHQVDDETIDRLAKDEAALVQQYNSFRAKVNGKTVGDNEIDRILAESVDALEVEAAWRGSKSIGEHRTNDDGGPSVLERLIDLVKLRNHAARQIGYASAYESALQLSELEPDWLFATLDALDHATRPIFQRWKSNLDQKLARRFAVQASELKPWHYGDRFFQTPPKVGEEVNVDALFRNKDVVDLTNRSFDALGFDIRPIVAKSDLFPGDPATSKKCQHAFCTSIDAPADVRVLCNIVPGQRWMSTNLHEFGHAVYGASLDPALPYMLRDDAHLLANEAIALLMERHMLDGGWLANVADVAKTDADRIVAHGRRQLSEKHLVFTRWVLVMCHFERELYRNPSRDDLASLWWDIVEEYQEVRRPERDRRSHDWASKIHFVGYPAYYQNYLLGEVFGTQLQRAVIDECGSLFGNSAAGEFLVQRMFRKGATLTWRELIEDISGKAFSIEPFVEVLN